MKRTNRSGFTLIELVVVMALLGIMMGAILRLLDPIKNIYNSTYNTVNTKTTGENMISFVEDKTRYSTNMLILENYVGVPQITPNEASNSAQVGTEENDYTDVIVIDNVNLRNFAFSDYPGDKGTTATRKNCRGTLYNVTSLGKADTLDFTKIESGTLGDSYGNFTYDINVDVERKNAGSTDEYCMLHFTVDAFNMINDGGTYVKEEPAEFTAERYFNLVNINLDNTSYNLEASIDFSVDDKYDVYPQETNIPSGLTPQQQKLFDTADTNNRYTYIFYKINKNNETSNKVVTFKYSNDPNLCPSSSLVGTKYTESVEVEEGTCLPDSLIPKPGDVAGYLSPYFTDGTDRVDDFSDYPIIKNTTFYIIYTPDIAVDRCTVEFYESASSATPVSSSSAMVGPSPNSYAPTTISTCDPDTQYFVWRDADGTLLDASYNKCDTKDAVYKFYPDIKNKCKVEFEAHSALFPVGNPYVLYLMPGEMPSAPTEIPESDVSGFVFDEWKTDDGTNTPLGGYVVPEGATSVKFVASFKVKPPQVCTVTISEPTVEGYSGGAVKYTVTIANGTDNTISDWQVKIKLPSGGSYASGLPWDIDTSTSGSSFIFKPMVYSWNGQRSNPINAHSSLTYIITINNPNVKRTYDYSKPADQQMTETVPTDCYDLVSEFINND